MIKTREEWLAFFENLPRYTPKKRKGAGNKDKTADKAKRGLQSDIPRGKVKVYAWQDEFKPGLIMGGLACFRSFLSNDKKEMRDVFRHERRIKAAKTKRHYVRKGKHRGISEDSDS